MGIAALVLGALPLLAQTPNPAGDFIIAVSNTLDALTITAYSGSSPHVFIPPEVDGVPVRVIGKRAFLNNQHITELVIPDTVTSIESGGAFRGCGKLAAVRLSGGITAINANTFQHCTSLTSVVIPEGVTVIGDFAFYGCTALASITIPQSVTAIKRDAFRGCDSLTSITIPKSVKEIDVNAFGQCENLTTVIFEEGAEIRFVRDGKLFAFSGCIRLDVKSQIAIKKAGYQGSF